MTADQCIGFVLIVLCIVNAVYCWMLLRGGSISGIEIPCVPPPPPSAKPKVWPWPPMVDHPQTTRDELQAEAIRRGRS